MFLARMLRRTAFLIFWLMSAYLVIALVIALSDQGQMTGELAATNQAPSVYPMWYAAPEVLDAARIGIVLYPLAAVAFLIASLISFATRSPAEPRERLPGSGLEGPAPEPRAAAAEAPATAPAARLRGARLSGARLRAPGTLCMLDQAWLIRAIGPDAADLFGLVPAELVGRPLLPLVMPQDAPRLQDAALAVHAHPDQPAAIGISLRQPDGTPLPVQAECHASPDAPGGETVLRLLPMPERGPLGDQLSALWY